MPAAIPSVPRWLATALFLLLTLVLFRTFIFSPEGMLLGHDTLKGGYAVRAFYAEQLRQGVFPRWSPLFFGGVPFLEALSGGDSLYPTSVLLLVMEPFRALGWKLVFHIVAAGFFMFAWVRQLGVSRAAALLSGSAYMLAPFLVTLVRSGHDGKVFVTALTPLLFLVTERFWRKPTPGSFSAVALVISLVLYTTHFQMAYFLFGAVGAFALFHAVRLGWASRGAPNAIADRHDLAVGRRLAVGRFLLFLTAALLGLGGAAVQVLPAVDYLVNHSRRTQTTHAEAGDPGAEWASSWSLHPEEAISLVIPEFVGSDAGGAEWAAETYWGRNFLKDNTEYGGILVLVLAAVAFAGGARPALRWFLVGMGVLALLYALGSHTPVWRAAYAFVPGIRLFRTPSMVIFLFGFATVTLAGLGVDRTFQAAAEGGAAWRAVRRVYFAAAGVLCVLAIVAASGALASFWTSVVYPDVEVARLERLERLAPFITRGAWFTALTAALAAGLAWSMKRGWVRPPVLLFAFLGLVVADAMRVDEAFVQVIDFHEWTAPEPTTAAVLEREGAGADPYRLLSFVDRAQDTRLANYGIELAAGHHPNDLVRYRELIGMTEADLPANLFNTKVERLLNVRYLLWPDYNGQGPPETDVVLRTTSPDGRPYMTLHTRPDLPRARLVARAVVKPEDEEVPYILSEAFRPESEVVLSEPPPVPLDGGPMQGSVSWQARTPNEVRLHVMSDRASLLVLADNWYPAWQATVDGRDVPVLRAYHTLRAVPVPAGTHTVRMVYRWPAIVTWSFGVSVVVLPLLAGTFLWSVLAGIVSRRPLPGSRGAGA